MSKSRCGTIQTDETTLKWVDNCLTPWDKPIEPQEMSCRQIYYDSTAFKMVDGVLTSIMATKVGKAIDICGEVKLDSEVFTKNNRNEWSFQFQGANEETDENTIIFSPEVISGEYQANTVITEFLFDHGEIPYVVGIWQNDYEGRDNNDGFFQMKNIMDEDTNIIGVQVIAMKKIPNQTYKLGISVKDKNNVAKVYQKTVIVAFD